MLDSSFSRAFFFIQRLLCALGFNPLKKNEGFSTSTSSSSSSAILFHLCIITCFVLTEDRCCFSLDSSFRNGEEFRRNLEQEAERLSKYELAQVLRLEKKNKKREEYQR